MADDADDPKYLRELVAWASKVDKLHERYFVQPRDCHAGSRLDTDDSALRPYHMSHEVTQRLSVAVDSLHGLRTMTMTEGDSGIGVGLRTYAPYPLLRAAIENACTVAWLLSPSDEATRVTRRFQLWAKSHDARHDVELLMKANEDKTHRVPEPVGWSRDLDWIERMRLYGVPDVDKTLKDPSVLPPRLASSTAARRHWRKERATTRAITTRWRGGVSLGLRTATCGLS